MQRRSFIQQTASIIGLTALHQSVAQAFPGVQALGNAPDDDFWREIRMAYAASPNIINLNNGGVCPSPRATMDALDYYNRLSNEAPSYYMWRILDQDREPLRYNLASLAGCDPEEITYNRNATEALNTIIFGLPLQAGDEVVLSKYDYPNMIHAWQQRELRDKIKLVWVDLVLPSEDEDYLVRSFTDKFTDKTRIVYITHIINWCGQILPAQKIAAAAHKNGAEVVIDGAHSFALLDYKIPDLGGDYFGTSLHKWLCAPIGTGMTWIKKDKIGNIWPLLSAEKPLEGNIRKFENLGTRSFPIEMAIGYSLDLHLMIGTARKQKRLHYLKNYWMDQVADLPNVRLHTSRKEAFGCAIGTFSIKDKKAAETHEILFRDWKIHTVGIDWEKINAVRVTPNVYTTTAELDKLVVGIRKMAGG
jgi:selenocysteine lyase/cysteine desulfurase